MKTKNLLKISVLVVFGLVMLPSITNAEVLNRQLEMTMTGSDVSALQTFLAKDATIYPQGLVTGYFGYLTKAAVSNFQTRNGISSVGRVGPATLPVLNYQISQGSLNVNYNNSGMQAPEITNVTVNAGRNNTTIAWYTNESAKGAIYYSSRPLILTEQMNSVDVYGASAIMTDASFRTNQSITIPNLNANTVYYYMIYTTDVNGNVSVTWPGTFQTTN